MDPDVTVDLAGIVDDDAAEGLCSIVRRLLDAGIDPVTVDALAAAVDVGLVDALARAELVARRCGSTIEVRGDERLLRLVELIGLTAAVRVTVVRSDQQRR